MTHDLWMLISFLINILVVFLMIMKISVNMEKRITRLETYLKIVIRHLNIDIRDHDLNSDD